MITNDDSILSKLLICISLLIAGFLVITFIPTKDDIKSTTYMFSNKTYKINGIDGTLKSMVDDTKTSGTGKLDQDWASHGYHPYAFVKDYPLSGIDGIDDGSVMTYTQTCHYHQHNCGDTKTCPIGNDTQGYRGNSCGWVSMCDWGYAVTNNSMTFDEWNKVKVTAFPGHPNWASYHNDVTKTWNYFNANGWEKSNSGGAKIDQLIELFDKGGVVVYSATGTAGAYKYTYSGHIVLGVGYVSKNGTPTHMIVVDCSQGTKTNNWIKSSGTAVTVGKYLTFVKLDKIKEPLNGSNGYLKIWPTNPPTSNNSALGTQSNNKNVDNSSTSSSSNSLLTFNQVINQYDENGINYIAGCEYAATAMAFMYLGISTSIKDIYDIGGGGKSNASPWTGFMGEPKDTKTGRGTYPPYLKQVCEKYANKKGLSVTVTSGYDRNHLNNNKVTDADKTSFKNVISLCEKGIPVIVWNNIYDSFHDYDGFNENSVYVADGQYENGKWLRGSHTLLLLGVDKDGKVVVADSDQNRIMHHDYDTFLKNWCYRGKMWVAIQKK